MPPLPSKAFVLAAGLGTRLRPLTAALPKPMLPLWGVPMIRHTLEMLRTWGVREAVLNLHHAPGPMIEYLAAHPVDGLRVSCLWEPELLGTGGALRQAAGFIGDAPCWLVNATWRAPLYRRWIYYHVTPQVDFAAEDDHDPKPSLRFGIEILFGRETKDIL